MLPPFHGERMRSYEAMVGGDRHAEIDSWPLGREFPIHARMQAMTLEVILRAVFGVAEGPRLDLLRGMLGDLLVETGSPTMILRALVARRTRPRCRSPRSAPASTRSTRRSSPRSPSTAAGPTWSSATTSSRC